MCQNCYHSKGRTKKAFKCEHSERSLYAKGICKNCYLSIYHKKKRSSVKDNKSNIEESHENLSSNESSSTKKSKTSTIKTTTAIIGG